jgi:hypothetical protein
VSVPAGAVFSNAIALSAVCAFCSLSATDRGHVPHDTLTRLNNNALRIHRSLLQPEHFGSPRNLAYSAAAGIATGSTLAAQNLYSGILPNGSSCGLVNTLAAASA